VRPGDRRIGDEASQRWRLASPPSGAESKA
jgi:hypothetical protein